VRTADDLVGLYFSSVGRNGKLLLNVPPTTAGLLHETDVARLAAFSDRLLTKFDVDLANGLQRVWRITGPHSATIDIQFPQPVHATVARLEEDITRGQIVARYALYGARDIRRASTLLAHGTTIGYMKLHQIGGAEMAAFRLVIEDAIDSPLPVKVTLFE